MPTPEQKYAAMNALSELMQITARENDFGVAAFIYSIIPPEPEEDSWQLINVLQARFVGPDAKHFMAATQDLRPVLAQGAAELLKYFSDRSEAQELGNDDPNRLKAVRARDLLDTITGPSVEYLLRVGGLEALLVGTLGALLPAINIAVRDEKEITEEQLLVKVCNLIHSADELRGPNED